MRLLLTGASGFLGRNLLLALPRGWTTVAVYHRSKDFPSFLRQKGLRQIHPVRCDLSRADELKRRRIAIGKTFDACIYLTANGDPAFSVSDPEQDLRMTALTVVNVLSQVTVKRLLYVSSGAVYGGLRGRVSPECRLDPSLPYAISHLAAEQYVKSFCAFRRNPREYLIVRFFGAYGPYEPGRKVYTRLVRTFMHKRARSFAIRGDGKNLIDAMYITDAVRALLAALRSPLKNTTFDLCSGNPLSIEALVQRAASVFGVAPVKIRKVGNTVEPIHFRPSTRFQKNKLRFNPRVSLEEGLRTFASFSKKESS